jgi:cytochrome P450
VTPVKAPRLDVDFSDPALVHDPFPVFEEIRSAGRVVWNDLAQAWMIAGYDDCAAMFTETKEGRLSVPGALRPEIFFWFDAPAISITEGEIHRRLRQPLARYFTPTAMERNWEARVYKVVDQLLVPLVDNHDSFDLDDFTKVAVIVVAELLGVPEERHDDFRRWSNDLIRNIAFGHENPEAKRQMDQVVEKANEYLAEEIGRHRSERPDDLLTVMVDIPDWSDAEVRAVALNLLLAGYETTAKLMGSALVALEQHPEQRRLLVDNPALTANAVEEVLRWVGPTQAMVRVVVQDTDVAGTHLSPGEVVYLVFGAANRDPARWDDPQRFDVTRPFQANMGFGGGAHICLGASLARLETRVGLEGLLRLAPEYRLRDVDYGNGFFARGPEHGLIDVAEVASAA